MPAQLIRVVCRVHQLDCGPGRTELPRFANNLGTKSMSTYTMYVDKRICESQAVAIPLEL